MITATQARKLAAEGGMTADDVVFVMADRILRAASDGHTYIRLTKPVSASAAASLKKLGYTVTQSPDGTGGTYAIISWEAAPK